MSTITEEPVIMRSDPWRRPVRHDSQLRLAALPTAVGCARRFARHTLQTWLLRDVAALSEAVDMVVSELVTNAIQATGITAPRPRYADVYDRRIGVVLVRLCLAEISVVVEVSDRDPNPPVPREPSADSVGGRGLVLVDAVSTTWGHYRQTAGGKVVWAELLIGDHDIDAPPARGRRTGLGHRPLSP